MGLVLLFTDAVVVAPVEVSHNVACHKMNRMMSIAFLFQLLRVCSNLNMEHSHVSTLGAF